MCHSQTKSAGAASNSIFASLLALVLAGCGYSPADYCNDRCECVGCSDEELDDCIDDAEDQYDDAVNEGCDDLADDYLSCLGEEAECRGDDFDADGCEAEARDAFECTYGSENFPDGPR